MSENNKHTLILVYNAEEGLFNAATDTMHRIFSPQSYECRLCFYTTSILGLRTSWKAFLDGRQEEKVFFHRNEFYRAYPEHKIPLPAIFIQANTNSPDLIMDRETICGCNDLKSLVSKLEDQINSWHESQGSES